MNANDALAALASIALVTLVAYVLGIAVTAIVRRIAGAKK